LTTAKEKSAKKVSSITQKLTSRDKEVENLKQELKEERESRSIAESKLQYDLSQAKLEVGKKN